MDLLTPAVIGSVSYAARLIAQTANDAATRTTIPSISAALVVAVDPNGHPELLITSEQHNEIRQFLSDPSVTALTRISALEQVAYASPLIEASNIGADFLADQFHSMARSWCERTGNHWAGVAPEIWNTVTDMQRRALNPALLRHLDPGIAEQVVERFLFPSVSSATLPLHVEYLVRLVEDGALTSRVSVITTRARIKLHDEVEARFDVHGDDTTASFDELYINRTLVNTRSGAVRSAADLLTPGHPLRAVIIGDPGNGKSTLVKWLRWRMSKTAVDNPVPLTVICRELLATRGASITEAMRRAFEMTYSEPISPAELESLLAIGAVCAIFDGLDEIQARDTRESIVAQLKNLEREFPMMAIVCTTRRTGFEVQAFNDSKFTVHSLDQYSESQVADYATRWFRHKGHVDRAQRFLGESRDLPDLRMNPLMLALLCALYSQQDYIPQSRREVYIRCVSFMFREWDPRRGISIPNIFKNRGDQALQAVATRIDRRGGYGNTLDSKELETVVREVLTRAGIDSMDAQASARELIEHCATRAWILSSSTDENGARRFGFTHRTFYEFFAAEATVREINRLNMIGASRTPKDDLPAMPLTRAILDAYHQDPTSVMPELLIQAGDDMADVSASVLGELLRLSKHQLKSQSSECVALAVRLLAAAGANARQAEEVIDALVAVWLRPRPDTSFGEPSVTDDLRPLLDIASSHRAIFASKTMQQPALAYEFARRYAELEAREETGLYSSDWGTLIGRLGPLSDPDDPVHTWFDTKRGLIDPIVGVRRTSGRDLFRIHRGKSTHSGVFWLWLADFRGDADYSIAVQRDVMSEVMKVKIGETVTDPTLFTRDAALHSNLLSGSLDVKLALLLALVTDGDADTALEKLAGAHISTAASEIRAVRVELDRRFAREDRRFASEEEDLKDMRNAVRAAYHKAIRGPVHREVWSYLGIPSRAQISPRLRA